MQMAVQGGMVAPNSFSQEFGDSCSQGKSRPSSRPPADQDRLRGACETHGRTRTARTPQYTEKK